MTTTITKVQNQLAQFARVEGKSVSLCIDAIGEATRTNGFCNHIDSEITKLNPPEYIYGSEKELWALALEVKAKAQTIKRFRGFRKGKAYKSKLDPKENVMLSGVATIPRELGDSSPALLEKFKQLVFQHLQKEYGENLKGVILHSDESQYDIHFFIVNDELDPSLDAAWLAERKKVEGPKKKQTKEEKRSKIYAEKDLMREWQDRFNVAVGIPCGLARKGEQSVPRSKRKQFRNDQQRKQFEAIELAEKEKSTRELQNKIGSIAVAAIFSVKKEKELSEKEVELNKAATVVVQKRNEAEQILENSKAKVKKVETLAKQEAKKILDTAKQEAEKETKNKIKKGVKVLSGLTSALFDPQQLIDEAVDERDRLNQISKNELSQSLQAMIEKQNKSDYEIRRLQNLLRSKGISYDPPKPKDPMSNMPTVEISLNIDPPKPK